MRGLSADAVSGHRPAPAEAGFGHIVSITGSRAVAVIDRGTSPAPRVEIGSLAKVRAPRADVVGIVSALNVSSNETADAGHSFVQLTLVGELSRDNAGKLHFHRGVARFPAIGDSVMAADHADLACVYGQPQAATIDVGTLYQDATVPARLLADELFSKHFVIVGTTGCGKSSALTGILQQVLLGHPHARVIVLDIHSEYSAAFGGYAELVNPSNLHLPFWLLNFQELCTALTSPDGDDAEVEILAEAVIAAKRRYSEAHSGRVRRFVDPVGVTADTPTPFRLSDIVAHIDEQVGRLERAHNSTLPYRRLKARAEVLATDARFGFLFGNPSVEDTMAEVLARIFRVPSDGRPITVLDLSTVPAEILDVVISLISRLAFDLAVWSDGGLPMLVVCEEAHRYAPAGSTDRFVPTRRALARIAKEGRKYGISLALISQRPSDLDTTIMSQCSTIVAMRLSTERDQQVVRSNTHDSAFDLLDHLPLLADREAIVLGQGVVMPMRIRFQDIHASTVPGLKHEGFASRWKNPNMDRAALEEAIARWRLSGRSR